jgi:thiamine biosynthesis lipoprotein
MRCVPRITVSAAVLLLWLPCFLLLTGCSREGSKADQSRVLYGYACELQVPADFAGPKQQALFAELEKNFAAVLPVIEDSEIRRLNQQAGRQSVALSEDVYRLLEKGRLFSDLTDGAYDITALPLRQLYDRAGQQHNPGQSQVFQAAELVDFEKLRLWKEEHRAYLDENGMAVDPVPLVRGWAVDQALKRMKELGAEHGAVRVDSVYRCFGDRLRTYRFPPGGGGSMPAGTVKLQQEACAAILPTAARENPDGAERRLFDTTTGRLHDTDLRLVVVTGPDAIGADALAYIVGLYGLHKGMALIEETPFFDALVVSEDDDAYFSKEMTGRVSLDSERYGVPQPWPEEERINGTAP